MMVIIDHSSPHICSDYIKRNFHIKMQLPCQKTSNGSICYIKKKIELIGVFRIN